MKTEPLPEKSPSNPVVPAESYQVKRSIWQRWMAWNGSFLVLSILLHIVLLGGATLVVVRVVEGRKEKLKFTAPPPSASASVEHKVKISKKAAAVPAISKRITSTAANASVALPAMAVNAMSSDNMSSVTSGLGSGELGSGVAGMAAMPLAGMTAFGFRGASSTVGLVGHLYDLTQTPNRKPTNIKDDGNYKNPHLLDSYTGPALWAEVDNIFNDRSKLGKRSDLLSDSVQNHAAVINDFIKRWDESALKPFYCAKDPLIAYQFFIPHASAADAIEAFGVTSEVSPKHFILHYKGFVKAPKNGIFRFRAIGGGSGLFIRFNNKNVYAAANHPLYNLKSFEFVNKDLPTDLKHTTRGYPAGAWMSVQAGQKYPMEILMESNNTSFYECIMIEDRSPEKPYPRRFVSELFPQDIITYCYPVFALRAGIPFTPYKKEYTTKQIEQFKINPPSHYTAVEKANWRPWEPIPQTAPEPMIFPGTK